MATTVLGKVMVTPKGAWNGSTSYEVLDIVTNSGNSYIAKKGVPSGTALTNTDYWLKIAEKGEKGDTGVSIDSVELNDDYTLTINFDDGTSTTTASIRGEQGNGIASISKTGTSGNVDTYTITFDDGDTSMFTVTNGSVTSVNGKTGAVTGLVEHDGYYDTLSVGLTDNLIDRKGNGNEQSFTFRTSCGDDSIADDGSGIVQSIKGNTMVWNQLVDTNTTSVIVPNGHKYRFYDKDGTDSIMTSNGTAFAVTGDDDMVSDLTQMFGVGKEPSTVEEFKALFPLDYYDYDAGSLLSYNGTGIRTNGFNQWDEEQESGAYDTLTGRKIPDNDCKRSKNMIPVLPNMTYYVRYDLDYKIRCIFYDADKKFMFAPASLINETITSPQNAYYMTFYTRCYTSDIYGHVNINLSWSGYRNGEYEPYWTRMLNFPVAQYFPTGMKSAGTAYDELTPNKATTIIGAVDLGTLTWTYNSVNHCFYSSFALAKSYTHNAVCAKYIEGGISAVADMPDKSFRIIENYPVVKDSAYTDATAFKTAMNGVYLFYEKAEPTEVTIDPPLDLTYKVADFGTEQSLPENTSVPTTTPLKAVIKYSDDYTRMLATLSKQYDTTDGLDGLLSALATMLGSALDGTVTITRGAYDSSTKKYAWTCTFTANE